MSHWRKSKLKLKCSLAVLRRALLKIMPQWEKHIKTDPNGNLTIHSGYLNQDRQGYHLVVPQDAGLSYADMGFKQEADGSWSVDVDVYPSGHTNFEGEMTREVAAMRAKAIAQARGYQITKDELEGNSRKVRLIVPVGEEFKLRA